MVLVSVLFLVTGVAHQGSRSCASCGADGGAFKTAARLVADEAAESRTAKTADCRAALGVRAGGSCAVRKGESDDGGGKGKNGCFH